MKYLKPLETFIIIIIYIFLLFRTHKQLQYIITFTIHYNNFKLSRLLNFTLHWNRFLLSFTEVK